MAVIQGHSLGVFCSMARPTSLGSLVPKFFCRDRPTSLKLGRLEVFSLTSARALPLLADSGMRSARAAPGDSRAGEG